LKKNQKFVYGLRKSLRRPLLLHLEITFAKPVDAALTLKEEEKGRSQEEQPQKKPICALNTNLSL